MTKKEVKLVKDTIKYFSDFLSSEDAKDMSHEDTVDIEARMNCLEWLLEATGNL